MTNIVKKTKLTTEESEKIRLTFAKLELQWWINKGKAEPDKDHSAKIQFAKHKLERVSGQKVKIKGVK